MWSQKWLHKDTQVTTLIHRLHLQIEAILSRPYRNIFIASVQFPLEPPSTSRHILLKTAETRLWQMMSSSVNQHLTNAKERSEGGQSIAIGQMDSHLSREQKEQREQKLARRSHKEQKLPDCGWQKYPDKTSKPVLTKCLPDKTSWAGWSKFLSRSWQNVFLSKRLRWSWQKVFLTKRLLTLKRKFLVSTLTSRKLQNFNY